MPLQALSLDAKSAYAHDVLGLAYANQGKIVPGCAVPRSGAPACPGEKFIRMHYLQVRALQIERARLENIKKGELNEKTS